MKLKEIRETRKLSQSELARKIGVSPQTINQVESGKTSISIETLIKIVEVLDCSADELLGIDNKNK